MEAEPAVFFEAGLYSYVCPSNPRRMSGPAVSTQQNREAPRIRKRLRQPETPAIDSIIPLVVREYTVMVI